MVLHLFYNWGSGCFSHRLQDCQKNAEAGQRLFVYPADECGVVHGSSLLVQRCGKRSLYGNVALAVQSRIRRRTSDRVPCRFQNDFQKNLKVSRCRRTVPFIGPSVCTWLKKVTTPSSFDDENVIRDFFRFVVERIICDSFGQPDLVLLQTLDGLQIVRQSFGRFR